MWSPSPEVSIESVASSPSSVTSTGTGGPLSGRAAPLYASVRRSTIARFTDRCTAGTLVSCDLCDRPRTGIAASLVIHSSHGTVFVVSNSASKSAAGNRASSIRTRSALRSQRFALQTADAGPSKRIRPGRSTVAA